MKRHGDLYSKIIDMDNLIFAYQKAKKGKSRMNNIKKFDENKDQNLLSIQTSLKEKTFHTSHYQVKTIHEPKTRDIYVLPFNPDRIVQHALMNIVSPIWDNLFIYDSYACREKKGIHAGSKRTIQFVRRNKYCLKCDISKFYPSIKHNILIKIIEKKIKCKDTLWLIKDIIDSIQGRQNVPIGNYTSQWFGNLYLNEMDYFIKTELKIKDYIRYCDDFCLFGNDKRYLKDCALQIEAFLENKLKLSYSKCSLFPVMQGVDFLGYRHFPEYILVRKSTAKRIRKRIEKLPYLLKNKKITLEQYCSILASTNGWLKWANTHNLKTKLKIDALMEECVA